MFYEYLITFYKVLVGLITSERLVNAALIAFGVYIFWVALSLIFSYQRKFSSRCQKVINLITRNQITASESSKLDGELEKISGGFYFGWNKFKSSTSGKPSDYITRSESLDVEINGGVLNQGKTLMKAYIGLLTFVLFVFNFAYVGGEKAITFMAFAETLVLPLVFNVVLKLFYFLYNSIRQKMYRYDVEQFYELVEILDQVFSGVKPQSFSSASVGDFIDVSGQVTLDAFENQDEQTQDETQESEKVAENGEGQTSEDEQPQEEEQEKESILDKYDIFKKKNINVDELISKTGPNSSTSTLPYIDVDSDYVIKDDEEVGAKQVHEGDNASSILSGMMQDMSSAKKNSSFIDVEKPIAEVDSEKVNEVKQQSKQSTVEINRNDNSNALDAFEKFEVNDGVVEMSEETVADAETETATSDSAETPITETEPETTDSTELESESSKLEEEKTNIASVVSEFKSNRSKLASGGIVIERNEPIAKRERVESPISTNYAETETIADPVEDAVQGVSVAEVNDDVDGIVNSFKAMNNGYEGFSQQYTQSQTNYISPDYSQGYGYNQGYVPPVQPVTPGYNYMQGQTPQYSGYAQAGYGMNNYSNYAQNNYNSGYNNYVQPNDVEDEESEVEEDIEEEVETPKKTKKVVRTKENEPRPRNLRKPAAKTGSKTAEKEAEEMAKRGRPKKQEVSESMTISNDKEFNEVLSRAEKLMRKSDEGLSESQSKRIEKELKILMDAMNRYKESK